MNRSSFAVVAFALFVGQFFVVRPLEGAEPASAVKITLHPQSEPTPALKYRLLPAFTNEIPGNAAVDYGKVTAEEMTFFKNRKLWDKIEDVWPEMPLVQLKRENIVLPSVSIYFLEQGGRRKYCDWQLPIGEQPFYTIMLPEAQQSRSYARILAVKARREMADGEFDEAVKTFQTAYALGRNVAEGETLVNGLIGIAICNTTSTQVLEFVQQPDASNLYWALTQLPDPLIDVNDALELESQGMELSFPELRDLEHANRTPEEWRDLFHRFASQVLEWIATSESPALRKTPEELDKLCQASFPTIKRTLLAAGMAPEKLEAMPLHQAALVYTLHLHHRYFDDAVKVYASPYPQAIKAMEATIQQIENPVDGAREIVPVAQYTMPAIIATRTAIARNDRRIAVLRIIEALRLYAAEHDGQLPQQLSDITQVPIPNDPATDQAFEYKRDGDKALLQGPSLRDEAPLNYEITMGPAGGTTLPRP